MESREVDGESPAGRHSTPQIQTGAPRIGVPVQNIDMMRSGNGPSRHVSASFMEVTSPALSLHTGREKESLRGKPRERYSVKWMIGISATGIFISGFVFVIVLFPLLYPAWPSTSRSVGNLHQRAPSSVGISEGKFSRTNMVFMSKKSSKSLYHESGDARAQNYYRFMMNAVEKAMNTSVNPCHDFYQYACGTWGVHNPPPNAVARWTTFDDMTLKLWKLMEGKLRVLTNDSIPIPRSHDNNPTPSTPSLHNALTSVRVLVVDYYKSCENEELLSWRGVTPLIEVLNEMDQLYLAVSRKLQPIHAFQKVLEFVHHKLSIHVLFSWKVDADTTVRDAMAIELNVPNIDLIQQGTKLKGKERLINVYGQYAKTLLKMVGTFNNKSLDYEVNAILELLKIFLPMKGSSIVNKMTIKNLNELAPILDWQEYFNSAFNRVGTHITKDEYVLSQVHDYLYVLSKHILSEISTWGLERLYVYLRWQVAQFYSQFLHKPARDALLPLISEISNVNMSTIPHFRLRPCIKEVVERLPLAIGHLLLETIKEGLPKRTSINDNIKAVVEMANIIRMEYLSYIESFTWLKANAKRVLLEKLSNTNIKVGYPPIVDNPFELYEYFKNIKFTTNYFTNQMALLKFNQDNLMRLLRQPGLYSEWQVLSPVSVISFYVYRRNALLVPLGGIMHPVYNTNLPVYMTYATMGSLISHELGHAVDLVGHTRDIHGKVNGTLWDEVTVKTFLERVNCRVKQYSQAYYPIQSLLTVSEVMADDASVGTAFMAASHHFQHIKLPATIINSLAKLNLSSEQFFFLYYAQMFCSASSPGSLLLGTLKHYPPDWARVTATLASTPQFQTAFSCHKGTAMNPGTEDCHIW